MKKTATIILFYLLLTGIGKGQVRLPLFHDSLFTTYYHQRWSQFQLLPQTKGDIVFIGNSITDGGEWAELFGDIRVKNRGISGDVSAGVLKRLEEIATRRPACLFIMIGINDLARGLSVDAVFGNIQLAVDYMRYKSISTRIYVQSLLPVSAQFGKFSGHTNKTDSILRLNRLLKQAASEKGYIYLDIYSHFCDETGRLSSHFTNDGLHLSGEGYLLWKHLIFPVVTGLQERPSLLPTPRELKWKHGNFPVYRTTAIVITDTAIAREAHLIKQMISGIAPAVSIKSRPDPGELSIELIIERGGAGKSLPGAYQLQVTPGFIRLKADSPNGIFNGVQTLQQLMRDGVMVDCCEISDRPAFSWRGYMVDVGRNYMSIQLLKEQIDIMSRYKLNVFHFHVTEDIAWRLASDKYPQLTAPEHMLRNKGQYYSKEEIRDLIAYCNERYIRFVPEIDMPGHSAAFSRAMGTDMQSDSGLLICKNILKELCDSFDLSMIHIGGDEVKITQKKFMPEIVQFLRSLGKTVLAWDPGGNVPEGTYLQMWNGKTVPRKKYPSIDSRHLYLNHFDPLEGVVATFNHIICDTDSATTERLGATLCNWPDRRVADELDLIRMNAVYPVMISFAERCWQGSGVRNFSSLIDTSVSSPVLKFGVFEKKLLDHQKHFFRNLSFPYQAQREIEWKLIGPYPNAGDTKAVFAPETPGFMDTLNWHHYASFYGGTIWLRHFWHPMIQSQLSDPEDSTTWYAIRRIWSDEDAQKKCWIGFNNLSRSPATDSPPVGKWDNRGSAVWVNGKLVPAPVWKRGSQKGHSEIPLTDEGYEYRAPTLVNFKKGWNIVLIKAPVAGFKSEWQNPLKWMFTFVVLED